MGSTQRIGIVGAGLAGLITAYSLNKQGFEVELWEAEPTPGGKLQSLQLGPWLVEGGAATLLARGRGLLQLVADLGLQADVVRPLAAANTRYLVHRGSLIKAPSSPIGLITSPLLSWQGKLRLAREPFIHPVTSTQEETVAEFFTRRCGYEVTEQFVAPVVAGIYAGQPAQLSMQAALPQLLAWEKNQGSLLKGAIKAAKAGIPRTIFSFKDGTAALTNCLAARLLSQLRLGQRVTSLTYQGNSWQLGLASGALHTYDAIVVALPLPQLNHLNWAGLQAASATQWPQLPYPPLAVVALGFLSQQVKHNLLGFGFLVPPGEGLPILGTQFNSSIFAARAPIGHALLTSFVGGTAQSNLVSLPDEAIIQQVLGALRPLLGITGQPVFTHVQRWQQAIPQYTPAYFAVQQHLQELENNLPSLRFVGNYRAGIGVEEVVQQALDAAATLAEQLQAVASAA